MYRLEQDSIQGVGLWVLLALSLLLEPQVVIMDEPTTAVDVLTQRSILDVLEDLRAKLGFSIILWIEKHTTLSCIMWV